MMTSVLEIHLVQNVRHPVQQLSNNGLNYSIIISLLNATRKDIQGKLLIRLRVISIAILLAELCGLHKLELVLIMFSF